MKSWTRIYISLRIERITRKGFWLSCFYCVRENQSSMKRLNASVHQTTNCCHKITMIRSQRANNAFIPKLFTFKILFSIFLEWKILFWLHRKGMERLETMNFWSAGCQLLPQFANLRWTLRKIIGNNITTWNVERLEK